MKLDSDIKGLVKGVFTGCGILCAIEIAVGIVMCAAGFFHEGSTPASIAGVIVGSLGGTAVAMLVFLWMAVSLQKSLDKAALGSAAVKRGVQAGYTQRLLAQGAWVVAAALVPFINTICGLVPLLFPKLAIYMLQVTGKLSLTQKSQTGQAAEADQKGQNGQTSGPDLTAGTSQSAAAAGKAESEPGEEGGEK